MQKRPVVEKDHGRIETRRVLFVPDVSWIDKPMRDGWKKLGAVGMIESAHEISVRRRRKLATAAQTIGRPSSESPLHGEFELRVMILV